MLSPNRFLVRWGSSSPSRLQPAGAPLLCAALLAAVVAPAPSWGQCRAAGSPGVGLTHTAGAIETVASSASPIPDLPSWPLRIDVSRKDVSWSYARGRAVLSTVIPVAVGGTLLRLHPHDRTTNTLGLAVGGVGLLVGPAMGQWCLGDPHTRTGLLYTAARASGMAGIGGIFWALQSGDASAESADLLKLPVFALAAAVGIGLAAGLVVGFTLRAIDESPRRRCDAEHDKRVAVSPTADAPTGGSGVRLSVHF